MPSPDPPATDHAIRPPRAVRRWLPLLLLAVASLAGASRLIGLERLPVWHDEVFTLIRVFGYPQDQVSQQLFSGRLLHPADLLRYQQPSPDHGWPDTLKALADHPEHAPLYYLLGRLATELPVTPLTALRGLAALCGLLSIPAVWWLMRALGAPAPAPWIAAALVACSPLHWLYAQEARQYSLWILLTIAATAALAHALRDDRPAAWRRYGLLLTLGLYSHLLFVLMLPIHAAYGLAVSWRRAGLIRPARAWGAAALTALLLFAPWLWILATRADRLEDYTSWMKRPIGHGEIASAWLHHLTRTVIDLGPPPPLGWAWLAAPLLGWLLFRFARQAPRPVALLLGLLLLGQVALVLGPDLLLGGSRSQHVRYVLTALLALQLMAAWTLGAALADPSGWRSRLAAGLVALSILAGVFSLTGILHAETWSSKNFSARNPEVARRLAGAERPLVVASRSGVATGELVALAYHLAPRVRILGEPADPSWTGPLPEYDRLLVLTPSERLQALLGPERTLRPVPGTWQWFMPTGTD